jgi:tol-pal system protein YbgF
MMQAFDASGDRRFRAQAAIGLAALLLLVSPAAARAQTATDTGSVIANQEIRIQQLEQQISDLTGKLEEATFQIKQLSDRLDKLQKDADFRLNALEQGAAAGAAGQAAATPGTTAGAPAATGAAPPPPAPGTQILGTLTESQLQAAQSGQAPAPAAPTGTQTSAVTPYELPGNTPQEQYEYAFGLLRQANYPEAEKAFAAFVQKNPNDVLAGNAQYWLGETYYVRGDYQRAAVAFAEGFQKYPNSGKAADNLLKLGMSLGEMGKTQDACTALSELLSKYPGAPEDLLVRAKREKQRYGCS